MHNIKIDFPGKYVLLTIKSDVKNLDQQNYEKLKSMTKNIEQITLLNL